MHDALYVLKLACKLFSVRAAAAKGNTVKFGNTSCWIHDRNGKLLEWDHLQTSSITWIAKLLLRNMSPWHKDLELEIKLIFGIKD